jgi:N-carbamoylputrescine amidase
MRIKVAGIQMVCREEKDGNVRKAVRMAELAAAKGAQIICFQELFNTHWFPRDIHDDNFLLAEDLNGPTVATMKTVAKGKGIALICPFFERVGDRYFNTAAVIDQQGGGRRHLPEDARPPNPSLGGAGLFLFRGQGISGV